MSLELILSEDDYGFFKRSISLLEERVITNFPDIYTNPAILSAIRNVPRHLFVNEGYKFLAYTDNALPTCGELTTSAPSVIARMIFHSGVSKGDRLLEVGTGTGYEAAVLAEMGVKVSTIEIDRSAAEAANRVLVQLGYKVDKRSIRARSGNESMKRYLAIRKSFPQRGQIELFWGNGQDGLAEKSPFNGIIVAASIPHLKHVVHLSAQLSAAGGRMVVPVGDRHEQTLQIIERKRNRVFIHTLEGISFNFLRMVVGQKGSR